MRSTTWTRSFELTNRLAWYGILDSKDESLAECVERDFELLES